MKLHTILALGAAATAALVATGASAADLLINSPDSIYSSPLFNFEGFYIGATGGGTISNSLYGNLGVVAGANFAITDGIIAGVEFQGDTYWNGGGYAAYDALALGRVGGFVSDNVLVTGDLGVGLLNGGAVSAFGGGAEMGLASNFGVRGDVQAISYFGHAPSALRASAGLIWHMD